MDGESLGLLIARLGVAIIAADGRITTAELAALARLDRLGLGPLDEVAREEIERAIQQPIDVRATCAALPPLGEKAAALLLTVIAELAASDRMLAPRERDVFNAVASHLGVAPATAAQILEAAMAPPPTTAGAPEPPRTTGAAEARPDPELQRAFRLLGLEPGADRSRLDSTYLDFVKSYDPARVGDLGPEFAALAVRRLAAITDAYEIALASLEAAG